MRIDAHQHFWHYNPIDYDWMGTGLEALRVNRLPANLQPLLAATNLDGSIAVQARQTLEENKSLLALADQHDRVAGVVGWVDLRSEQVDEQLARFAPHPKFVGVRHVVQDEPDDRFMLRPDFLRGIGRLSAYNLTYDILVFPKQLPAAIELVAHFPDQPFVLDHIAKPLIKDGVLVPWADDLQQLAQFPNVTCKLSGMVTEADWHGWSAADFKPYLDIIFEAFGPQRLMFGSDWPVCTLAGSYQQVYELVANYVAALSADEQAAIFGRNAARFYRLSSLKKEEFHHREH